jgi:hypothetical protein
MTVIYLHASKIYNFNKIKKYNSCQNIIYEDKKRCFSSYLAMEGVITFTSSLAEKQRLFFHAYNNTKGGKRIVETQINSKTDSSDRSEQAAPEAQNGQQTTSEKNQINADIITNEQPETQAPDVTNTETIADTSIQLKQVNPAQDVVTTTKNAPVLDNADISPAPTKNINKPEKAPIAKEHKNKPPKEKPEKAPKPEKQKKAERAPRLPKGPKAEKHPKVIGSVSTLLSLLGYERYSGSRWLGFSCRQPKCLCRRTVQVGRISG